MKSSLRHRFFGWWAGILSRYPVPILVIATVVALAAIAYSYTHWQFQSDRNLLISNNLEWNRRFIDIEDRLPDSHDMVVVVDAGPHAGDKNSKEYKEARAVIDELGPKLKASSLVDKILWGFDPREASPKAVRLLPTDPFKVQMDKIAQSGTLLKSPTPGTFIGNIVKEAAVGMMSGGKTTGPPNAAQDALDQAKAVADLNDLNRILQAFSACLTQPVTQPVDFDKLATAPDDRPSSWEYLPSENGRLLFIRLGPKEDEKLLDPLEPALLDIRRIVADTAAHHPSVQIGITGLEVMDAEETQVANKDSTESSIAATLLITALLILAFHSWRTPMLAVLALLYGVAWTYGFLFLAVGHLQVLSIVFNILLLGLGIAYGIYLASAFELIRHDYPDDMEGFRQSLARTLEMMGPGIATGSFTTAAAFATTIFTDFSGVAEMGKISGVGILLCLTAMFTVFPVFLRLFKHGCKHITPMEDRYVVFFQPSWAMPFVRHPVKTLALAAILSVGSLLAIFQMRFDFDLIKLQPAKALSVIWMHKIMDDGHEQKIWSNLTIVNSIEEGRALADKFRKLPSVDGVGGIGLLFPEDEPAKFSILTKVRNELGPDLPAAEAELHSTPPGTTSAPATSPLPATASGPQGDVLGQFLALRTALKAATYFQKIPVPILAAMNQIDATLDATQSSTAKLTSEERDRRLLRLTHEYAQWRAQSVGQIAAALDPTPLAFTDLPHEIMDDYRDNQGHYVLEVYPNLKECPNGPLDPVFLPRFIADTRSVEPKISGIMVQIYESGTLIKQSYENAGFVALALVMLIVFFDYAGWRHTLVVLPLAILSLQMILAHSVDWRLHLAGVPYAATLLTPWSNDRLIWFILFALICIVLVTVPSFRRGFHDAMLILLPVAMAFAITFGIMWLVGMQVNAANIIVLPLMFGIGVDSGVHVLNRYRQDPDGEPIGLTQGTGKGITITCLTSVIGFGAMMISSHRGIFSLGFVLTLGLTMTMLACWTVMPAWLELRKRMRAAR